MPEIGTIVVKISPVEAEDVARWLRNRPPPLLGVPRINMPILANGVRLAIVENLEAIARRRRRTLRSSRLEIAIDRDEATWLGMQVAGGMFGSASNQFITFNAKAFCTRCLVASRRRRGRPKLTGNSLHAAVDREHMDPRNRKKLRRRVRDETSMQESLRSFSGALGRILLGEIKSP